MQGPKGSGATSDRPPGAAGDQRRHTHDEVEQELLELRALIESTVLRHRRRRSSTTLVQGLGPQEVLPAISTLVGPPRPRWT